MFLNLVCKWNSTYIQSNTLNYYKNIDVDPWRAYQAVIFPQTLLLYILITMKCFPFIPHIDFILLIGTILKTSNNFYYYPS